MEAWDIKTDDTRVENSLPTFIIFCEDTNGERIYFEHFETSLIKVNTIPSQKSKYTNVIKAITYCIESGLFEMVDECHKLKENTDLQVWCVFDRDLEPEVEKHAEGNTSFNESINIAKTKGINVAWSNDAFELWILLHFENVDPLIAQNKSRSQYYARLTSILKGITTPNALLNKTLMHLSFSYKKDFKNDKKFREIILPMILPNTAIAIERAKALESHHKVIVHNHEKKPCTMVYLLVEELIRLGKKI